MTPEQKQVLINIAARLPNKRQLDKPMMCYALDENILPDDDYEEVCFDKLTIERFERLACVRDWFLGLFVVFFRNFYEYGSGENYWMCTPALNCNNGKEAFRRFIRSNYFLCNECMPEGNDNRIIQWVWSQCCVLKIRNLSALTVNNREMYQLLKDCDYLQSEWNNKVDNNQHIDVDTQIAIEEKIALNAYLNYLWKNHRMEYLSSLKALFSRALDIENAPSWAKRLKINANDVVDYTWKLSRRSDGTWAPALEVYGNHRSIQIKQEDRVLESENGIFFLYFLKKNGFNLQKSVQICKEKKLILEVPSPISDQDSCSMLFKTRGNKEWIQPGNGNDIPDKVLFGGSFYVLTPRNYQPCIRLENINLVGKPADINVYGGFHCFEYRIPYAPEDQIRRLYIEERPQGVRVSTRPRIVPCNSTEVVVRGQNRDIIAIEDTELRFYAYGMQNVCVDGMPCQEQEPGSSYYSVASEVHLGACDGDIRNMQAIHYGIKIITAEYRNTQRQLCVLFLPSDWKARCRQDDLNAVITKARAGKHFVRYSAPDGAEYQLEYPLERPVVFWMRGNEMLECLNEKQYLEDGYNLNIIRPYDAEVDAKLITRDREYLYHVSDTSDFLNDVFRETVNRVKIGEKIIVKIGEQIVYDGEFRPNFCYIHDGCLYCPQSMRAGARLLCHGASYYTHEAQIGRQYYRKSVELDSPELVWDEYGATDISEWYELYPNELIIRFLYDDWDSWILIKEIIRDALPVNFEITVDCKEVDRRLGRCECNKVTSSLRAFLHAYRNNYHLDRDASDIYDEWGQQDIMFHRLCNSYVGINLDNEINQPWYKNEEKEDEWWNCWSLRLNTLKDKMLTWSADAHPEYVLSSGELETLGDKIFSKLDIEKVDRFLILWNNMKTVASVSRLFVLAAAISLGKGKVHLNVKEAVFLSYSKWFYSRQFPSALKKMCSFMELVKASPFRGILQQIEYLFEPVRNNYIAIPRTNWLLMVNRLVHTFNLSLLWPRLAEELHRNHNMNRNNIMIAAIFYHLCMHLVHQNQNVPILQEFIHNHNVMVGMVNLNNFFGNNGIYSDRFFKLNKFFKQQISQF